MDAGRERILSVWQWQWGHLLGKVAVSWLLHCMAVGTLAGQGGSKLAVALYGTKCVVYVEGKLW